MRPQTPSLVEMSPREVEIFSAGRWPEGMCLLFGLNIEEARALMLGIDAHDREVFAAGRAAAEADMAALQRRAASIVHRASRLPVLTPEVLDMTGDEARVWHAQRRAIDAERFRASVRGQGAA